MKCPECGCENLPRDKFWGECWHNLTLPTDPAPKELPLPSQRNQSSDIEDEFPFPELDVKTFMFLVGWKYSHNKYSKLENVVIPEM